MFSHIHVITRNWEAKSHESDWSIFFLIGQFFILKNLQPKIHFCFWDVRSHWPGLLRCCVRALCAFLLIFCAAVWFYFLLLFFLAFLLLLGINISFFGVAITKLVIQFFLLFHFCIYWHVVTSALRIFLFACLLIFLLFTIVNAFACLPYFFAVILCSA